jgi:hypothetical protein
LYYCTVLLLHRLMGDVEVKAPGAVVAVSKAGVVVEAERPGELSKLVCTAPVL